MPLGISGLAETPANLKLHKRGRTIGLAEAFNDGYVAVYAEAYSLIFAEGYIKGYIQGTRITLRRLGTKRLGPPSDRIEAEIATMGDIQRLREPIDRVFEVATWDELLAPSHPEA